MVALVTGASSGIGRAVARKLGSAGMSLLLVARRETLLEELARELRSQGAEATPAVADLSDEEQLERVCQLVARAVPPVDVLVNCAGIQSSVPFVLSTRADWDRQIGLNLVAPLRLAQAVARRLREVRLPGLILNMSSVEARVGLPGAAVYCATKGALEAWGRAVAAEWAAIGIRVVCVAPGVVRTELLQQMGEKLGREAIGRIERAHPLGFGEAEDVAEVVVSLLGPAGRWMTGSTVVVDGGYTAT